MFKNFLIAKEKFRPDYFLYENNKSAARPIKDQIAKEFGVTERSVFGDNGIRMTYINSALVSAQNRQRFYVTNFGDIEQPEDRGILLRDILETGESFQDKSYCLTATEWKGSSIEHTLQKHVRTQIAEPVCVAQRGRYRDTGSRYATPIKQGNARYLLKNLKYPNEKSGTITACCYKGIGADGMMTIAEPADGTIKPIYEVRNGYITIKDKQYKIKLADGYYIIRKLTVKECCRLQTMPDDFCRAVSNTQAYKGLGNGWTAEVIIHLLNHALKDVPRNEPITVLSMYDGIGTGHYCLDKMGFKHVKYHAYEIDKYAMQISASNYPGIVQHGDAFAVREDDWKIESNKIP